MAATGAPTLEGMGRPSVDEIRTSMEETVALGRSDSLAASALTSRPGLAIRDPGPVRAAPATETPGRPPVDHPSRHDAPPSRGGERVHLTPTVGGGGAFQICGILRRADHPFVCLRDAVRSSGVGGSDFCPVPAPYAEACFDTQGAYSARPCDGRHGG